MRYVCLFALMLPVLFAQDGAAIYKERCASCHDAPKARVPALAAIKAMSGEAIYRALTSGVMKTQAEGLSTAADFRADRLHCPDGRLAGSRSHIYPNLQRRRAFSACRGLAAMEWLEPERDELAIPGRGRRRDSRFPTFPSSSSSGRSIWAMSLLRDPSPQSSEAACSSPRRPEPFMRSMPIPAVLAGDFRPLQESVRALPSGSPTVRRRCSLPTAGGTMYALNAETGELIWKVRPVEHFATMATATPRYYKGVVYEPFASFEEALGGDPKFQCCTFRGSVVALDAGTGKKIWQTFTIPEIAKPTHKNSGRSPAVRSFGRRRVVKPDD